jgi:sugar phosphate isomerase/epimerase
LAILKEMVSQEIIFEIDTYWVQTGGYDAAKLVQEFGKQASLLHIKDGPCLRGEPMTAVGEGVMNFDEIVDASAGNADWMIVELDACATDMLEAVGKSYQYLIQKGQAYGKK